MQDVCELVVATPYTIPILYMYYISFSLSLSVYLSVSGCQFNNLCVCEWLVLKAEVNYTPLWSTFLKPKPYLGKNINKP